jgi:hypothetical protein
VVYTDSCLEGTFCSHVQCRRDSSALKMEAAVLLEVLVKLYKITYLCNSEDCNLPYLVLGTFLWRESCNNNAVRRYNQGGAGDISLKTIFWILSCLIPFQKHSILTSLMFCP